MYHKIVIAGRVTRDPEMRYLADGTAVTSVSMAVDSGFGENKHTIWFRVTFWRKPAEIINQYIKKGSKLLVDGTLNADRDTGNPRTFTRQDGTTGAQFEMTASDFTFLSSRAEDEGRSLDDNSSPSRSTASAVEEDDIPF